MWSRNTTRAAATGWTPGELHSLLTPDEPAWADELTTYDDTFAALLEDDRDGRFLELVDRFLAPVERGL